MSRWRWLSWAGVAALVMAALVVGTRPDAPSSADDRAAALAESLRCPVCQGLSVADSNSETARSIRADIVQRIDDGQSDAEIRQAYVDRYSEWILLRPRGGGFGALVWFVPLVAVAAATAAIILAVRRRRRGWQRAATERDRILVAQALGDHPNGHENGHEPEQAAEGAGNDSAAAAVPAGPRRGEHGDDP